MDEAEILCDRVAIVDLGKVIALDTPRALVASLGAEHVVEFRLVDAALTPSQSTLAALPGVRDARSEGDAWALATSEVHLAVPALLDTLRTRGAMLSHLTTHSATLEDVFVSLTGGTCAMPDRGGTYPALLELTLARLREFIREPEAVFWVFVFPILMTCALGVAFRSRGDQASVVAVVDGPGRAAIEAALTGVSGITVSGLPPGEVDRALQRSDVQLVIEPGTPPTYRFDPTRAESRLARRAVDEALQRAAGRHDQFTARDQPVETVGSRYIDWLVPVYSA
jgi:hypothetical protein